MTASTNAQRQIHFNILSVKGARSHYRYDRFRFQIRDSADNFVGRSFRLHIGNRFCTRCWNTGCGASHDS